MTISLNPLRSRKIPFPGRRDGEAEAGAERLPRTTRRIRGAPKGAVGISRVRLQPEPAPAVRWQPCSDQSIGRSVRRSVLRIEHDRRRNGECHIFVRTMLSKSKLQPASAFKDWLGGIRHGKVPEASGQ